MAYMNYLIKIKKRPYLTGLIVLFVSITLFFVFRKETELDKDVLKVLRSDLVNEVNVTGRVKALQEVNLGFEKSGRVSSVSISEGDRVFSGQVLVRLENGSLLADLEKSKANLKSAEAVLNELKRGSRPEEITIQETKIENAKNSLQESKQALLDEIKKSFTVADDAIRNKVDLLFSNPRSSSPKLSITTTFSQLKIDVESERIQIEEILSLSKINVGIITTNSDLKEVGTSVKFDLIKMSNFLDKMALIVNSLEVNSNLSQTTIDSYKSDVSSARTSINTAISNISAKNDNFISSNSTLNLEIKNLELMIAGSDPQKVIAQEAVVEGAKADVTKNEAELRKTIITSPINGVVTKQEVKIGEIISANSTPISIISDRSLQVEVNVPETDVVLIAVGNSVRVNLDAYDRNTEFLGKVISINPGEIILQGVPAYKTTILFTEDDSRIRPGMTADVFILADTRENTLNIPRRAVLREGDREYVRVLVETLITERDVKTGFKSSDGRIEILDGLKEGEEIIVYIEEK